MARWLLLPLGLAVAGAAAWLLLASPGDGPAPSVASGPAAPAKPTARAKPAVKAPSRSRDPEGIIDEASRRQLEEVLEREGLDR
jgi:hypothetical protein